MMSIAYNDILASTTFQFTVGPERCIYHIHAYLACHVSPVFNRLISGGWKEASAVEVILDDIDEGTFIRFWQYAYCGDYTVPLLVPIADSQGPNIKTSSSDYVQRPDCREQDSPKPGVDIGLKQTRTSTKATLPRIAEDISVYYFKHPKRDSLISSLKRRCRSFFTRQQGQTASRPVYLTSLPPASKLARLRQEFRRTSRGDSKFQPPRNIHPEQSMREVLLSHAQLYAFADRYDCSELRKLILARLKMTLACFTVFEQRVEDLLVVILYIYNSTIERDEIRVLLVDFGLCITPTLAEHPLWKDFADTVPEYVCELHRRLKEILGLP